MSERRRTAALGVIALSLAIAYGIWYSYSVILVALLAEFGSATAQAAIEAVLDGAERQVRGVIAGWRDGVYHGEAVLDDDGQGAEDITIRATVTKRGPHAAQGPVVLGEGAGYIPAGFIFDTTAAFTTHNSDRNPRLCAGCHVNSFTTTDLLTGEAFVSVGHLFQPDPCLDPVTGIPVKDNSCAYLPSTTRNWSSCVGAGCHANQDVAASALSAIRDEVKSLANQLWNDVDPAVNEIEGCYLYDVDDLERVVEESVAGRREEAVRAEGIVAEEAEGFRAWRLSLDVVPAIASLRARAESIRTSELERAEGRLNSLSPSERRAVESLTAQIVNKLLHAPTVRMKQAAAAADGVLYADAVRHLFDLDDRDSSARQSGE